MVEDLLFALARMPLFSGLPDSCLADIAHASRWTKVSSGEVLFRQGEQPKAFYHVLSGQVKLVIASDAGDEKVMEICITGESFGLPEIFSGECYLSYAQAVADSNLVLIGKEGIGPAIVAEPMLAVRMLAYVSARHMVLERDIASYCFHSSCRRVLDFLLQQASPMPEGETLVALNSRKGLIAARLGLTPESFSRALRDLSTAGLIAVSGKHVTLQDGLIQRHRARQSVEQTSARSVARNRRRADDNADHALPSRPIGSRSWM